MQKIKISLIGILTLLMTFNSFGQGWEITYPAPVDTLITSSITMDEMPNGDIAIYNEGYSQLLTINTNSSPTWSAIQSIGSLMPSGFEAISKDNIIAANDGNFILVDDNNDLYSGGAFPTIEIHIAKLDPNLDTLWTKKHEQALSAGGFNEFHVTDVKQLSDNNLLILSYLETPREIRLIKVDYNNGNILWTQTLPNNLGPPSLYRSTEVIENTDGTLVLCSQTHTPSSMFSLTKLSALGTLIWNKDFVENIIIYHDDSADKTLVSTSDGGYLFSINKQSGSSIIIKTDANGNEMWRTSVSQELLFDLVVSANDEIYACGKSTDTLNWVINDSCAISKLDMNGNIIWEKKYSPLTTGLNVWNIKFHQILEINNNEFIAAGMVNYNSSDEIYAVRIDSAGNTFTNFIQGSVYNDQNLNCTLDNGETGINLPMMIRIVQGTDTTFTVTDILGNYSIGLLPGTYELTAISSSAYWGNCPTTITTLNTNSTVTQNLGLQALIACSDLKVNITSPNLTRCFSNTYYVDYSNVGTQDETNAYIEIEFDPFLIVNSASIPYTSVGNLYTFPVGNLNINQSGQFTVDVTVDCNSVLGQMHCVDATIYPNQICLLGAANWQGATIIADAFCDTGDSVKLRLENIGAGDMTQSRNYYVIEDQILPYQGSYYLLAGQDTTIALAANGYSYQIQADQEITHPWGNNVPSAVTFGCNLTDSTITINGLINQFNLDDYLNFVDVDCQQNVGSYDPNDKRGFPLGYGSNNSISGNTEIEYMLRFQNTGTAPAVNVRVEDEIDLSTLDLSTLEMQSSSHAYVLSIEDGNKLVFNFNNIMLPDSNANEPASHGFVRFKIAQKANNPIGTIIENDAAIYFDFNAPIITNITLHTIDENFISTGTPIVTPTCSSSFTINPINIPNPSWQLIANPTGTAPFTYEWTFNNTISFQTTNSSTLYTFSLNDSTEVCLTVTDATGCISTSCQTYTPQSTPSCNATFSTNIQDGMVDFTAYTNSSFLIYNWNFGDGNTGSGTNPTHYYTASGIYYVCITASNMLGCSDTYCDSVIINLPIPNNCNADFSIQMMGTNTAQFTNLSTGGSGQTTYMWDFGNGASGNAQNPQYTYDTPGEFVVTLTMSDSVNCTSTASDTVTITTNTSNINLIEDLKISPNPVTDLLQVQLNLIATSKVEISIINMTGQRVRQHQENLTDGNHRVFLPTNDLPIGMYLLHIQTENGLKTMKFLKQ
jgi:PKD repeat protein